MSVRRFADAAWASPLRTFEAADEEAAAATLYGIAEGAARAACEAWPGPVEVLGTGALAEVVRALLAERGRDAGGPGRPAAIVDTPGDAAALRAALGRLDDLGSLVLAAPPADTLDLDLYPDIHVRGLRIHGVAPARELVREASERGFHQRFLDLAHAAVPAGAPPPAAARWLEITG